MPEPPYHDRFSFYGDVKAVQLCYALALAEKLSEGQVVAHALHPGCATTDIVRAWPCARLLAAMAKLIQITPREAASYVARVCLAEDTAPTAGKGRYYHCGSVADPGPVASV